LAKKHLQLDAEFLDDDTYVTQLIEAAEHMAEREICHSLADWVDEEGKMDAGLQQGVLLLIGQMYNTREPVSFGGSVHEVPLSAKWILRSFRDYKG
jgi:hypothetical protein